MLARLILRSLTQRSGRRALGAIAAALGTSVVLALLAVAADVGDRVARELRAGGTNIVILPEGAGSVVTLPGGTVEVPFPGELLPEEKLADIMTTFWANNIVAISPVLELAVRTAGDRGAGRSVLLVGTHFDSELRASAEARAPMGLSPIAPYGALAGRMPADAESNGHAEALVGTSIAKELAVSPGTVLHLDVPAVDGAARTFALDVVGTFATGSEEDDRIFAPLHAVQEASGNRGRVSKVLVSAVLAPEDRLYERAMKDMASLSRKEYELYMCRAYPGLVAADLAHALPGAEGRPLFRTADAEGRIVTSMRFVTVSAAGAVVVSAALAVFAALAASILERRREVGLLKAIGASRGQVLAPFLAETAVTGLIGGATGFALGAYLARLIGQIVFGRPEAVPALLFVPALAVAMALALMGSLMPLLLVDRLDAAAVLKGD